MNQMRQYIIELAKAFEQQPSYLDQLKSKYPEILDSLFPNLDNKNSAIKVLRELFLRPYLTSKELSEKLGISREELVRIYSSIRSSSATRILFELSPYYYLIKVLGELSRDSKTTMKILEGKTQQLPTKTLELFISESCNAKCNFCYRDGKVYDKSPLSTEEYVALINEFADLGGENLDVCGGLEPLLSPSVIDVLEAGRRRNLITSLYTNGIALGDPKLTNALLRIDKVRVSLNASDEETYREIVGVDKFNEVKDNLRNLVKAKKRADSKVKIGISFLVLKENFRKIMDAIVLAEELNLDFLDLRSVHVTKAFGFDEKERNEVETALRTIKPGIISGKYKVRISIADTFNLLDPDCELIKVLKRDYVNDLVNFRITASPQGGIYALNVIAQPTREDPRYLLGSFNGRNSLSNILANKKHIPFEPELLLPHDISLVATLPKLKADLEFGISLDENPFNFSETPRASDR